MKQERATDPSLLCSTELSIVEFRPSRALAFGDRFDDELAAFFGAEGGFGFGDGQVE